MNKVGNITGLDKVMQNLNKEIMVIKGRSMKGLILSAIVIRNDMDKTPPLIPVDTGNLRQSWFTTPFHTSTGNPAMNIGFSANYAIFVHEMVGEKSKKINWNRPNSGAKFFEASLKRNMNEVLQIIQREAKIQ